MFYCDYFIIEEDDHIASYVEISVLPICVCAMFQEIIQNKLNLTVQSQEMRTKRRLLLVLVIIIVIIWFASLRNRGRRLWPPDTQCCPRKQISLPPHQTYLCFSIFCDYPISKYYNTTGYIYIKHLNITQFFKYKICPLFSSL
jgi:hypothetical protein